jgi:hypothetical protein
LPGVRVTEREIVWTPCCAQETLIGPGKEGEKPEQPVQAQEKVGVYEVKLQL